MSARYMVVFTTLAKEEPPASRIAPRFFNACTNTADHKYTSNCKFHTACEIHAANKEIPTKQDTEAIFQFYSVPILILTIILAVKFIRARVHLLGLGSCVCIRNKSLLLHHSQECSLNNTQLLSWTWDSQAIPFNSPLQQSPTGLIRTAIRLLWLLWSMDQEPLDSCL